MEASRWGKVECVQALLDRGAQDNHENEVSPHVGHMCA